MIDKLNIFYPVLHFKNKFQPKSFIKMRKIYLYAKIKIVYKTLRKFGSKVF